MANVTWQQHSFSAGQIDRGLMGRQDLDWYGSSCATLENMTVAKQGYVSKRAGTNLVASLKNLLGTSVPIEKIRMIAVESKLDRGYYLIFTDQKGYVVSDDGILLKDGSYTRKIKDYEENHEEDSSDSGDGAAVDEAADKVPFSFAVPWRNEDLDDVKFCQSGDTIFTAHNDYPPGKIFNNNGSFSYSVVEFSARKWKRPRIIKCEKNGVDGGGGLASVTYVCTYVKDGIESEPSIPFDVSYSLPWKQGGIIKVSCDKGGNEVEPDYYNVYKKTSTDYGLIASRDMSPSIIVDGSLSGNLVDKSPSDQYFKYENGLIVYATHLTSERSQPIPGFTPVNSYLNIKNVSLLPVNSEWPFKGVGGIGTNVGDSLTIDLGSKSGTVFSLIRLDLDTATFFNSETYSVGVGYEVSLQAHVAGSYFECTVTCETLDGKVVVFEPDRYPDHLKKSVAFPEKCTVGKPFPGIDYVDAWFGDYLFSTTVANSKNYNEVVRNTSNLVGTGRFLEFDFLKMFTGYFKVGTNLEVKFNIKKIEIKSWIYGDKKYVSRVAAHGVSFVNAIDSKSVIGDEYYAPDYTYTPPVMEPKFDREGDYPSCVALYKQRLVYASSKNDPFTIWMSCVGDLYNFNTHASIREDDALEVTLEAQRFPRINYLVQIGQGLMAFTDGGEFFIAPSSGNALSYKTVSSRQESSIGVANYIFPIRVGSEIVFIEGNQRTMRALQYNYTSDNHESVDLSVRDQEMFADRRIVEMCYKQHPNSELVCVLEDGSIAEISYMREQQLYSWSRQVLGGGWFAVGCASNSARHNGTTDVNLLVARPKADGSVNEWAIWKVRDTRDTKVLAERVTMDGLRVVDAAEEIAADEREVDLGDGTKAVGHPFRSLLVTVYPEAQDIGSTMQIRLKNARTVRARVVDAETFYIVPECLRKDERNWSIVETGTKAEGGALELVSGDFTVTPTGTSSEDGRLAVIHEGVLPFRLLYLAADFDFNPTIGQRGRG